MPLVQEKIVNLRLSRTKSVKCIQNRALSETKLLQLT